MPRQPLPPPWAPWEEEALRASVAAVEKRTPPPPPGPLPPWREPAAQPPPPPPGPLPPWKPRPSKRSGLPQVEVDEMREEQQQASSMHLRWQDRGPAPPKESGVERWRGQKWREGLGRAEGRGRWGNRGGQHSWWYSQSHWAYKQGPQFYKEWLQQNPNPKKARSAETQ